MKNSFLCLIFFFTLTSTLWGQQKAAPGSAPAPAPATPSTPSTSKGPSPTRPAPKAKVSVPITKPKPLPSEEKNFSGEKIEGIPGIVARREDKWIQSDFLGYLTNNIGIKIEILAKEQDKKGIDSNALEQITEDLFKQAGLNSKPLVSSGSPPLPFLHILVMIHSENGTTYAIYTAARLFEHINVFRENFEPSGFWQGITWEDQFIEMSKVELLPTQVKKSVQDVVSHFLKRYRDYNPREF